MVNHLPSRLEDPSLVITKQILNIHTYIETDKYRERERERKRGARDSEMKGCLLEPSDLSPYSGRRELATLINCPLTSTHESQHACIHIYILRYIYTHTK